MILVRKLREINGELKRLKLKSIEGETDDDENDGKEQ